MSSCRSSLPEKRKKKHVGWQESGSKLSEYIPKTGRALVPSRRLSRDRAAGTGEGREVKTQRGGDGPMMTRWAGGLRRSRCGWLLKAE